MESRHLCDKKFYFCDILQRKTRKLHWGTILKIFLLN